jgi:hypothetical protein
MSTTIQMPTAFDAAVRSVCAEAVNQAVSQLAAKYGFDCEDALRELNLEEIKLVRKRGPSPKQETKKSATKSKKTKKEKDPNAPKRAKTGYLLFQDEMREGVRAELTANLAEDTKLKPQDVVKAIADLWTALGKEEKSKWTERAKAAAGVKIEEIPCETDDDDE